MSKKNNILISVTTPTIRKRGLRIVKKALKQQSFKNFEWLIGAPFNPKIKEAKWIKDDFKGGFWSLNRIYNKLFKKAKGELFVSLQDWIYVLSDGLENFWTAYKKTGGIISGVGDQYQQLNSFGKPEIKIWVDPRRRLDQGSFYECFPNDCEWNWAAIPKRWIYEVGGMDEGLDFLGYGGDQLQICDRMDVAGAKFYLDQTNESFTLRHGRVKGWDENHVLHTGAYDKRKAELIKKGIWPKLNYL